MLNQFLSLFIISILFSQTLFAQGSLKGVISDITTKEKIEGVTIFIIGTYKGGMSDIDGNFDIKDVKPGEYSIRMSLLGYQEKVFNGIKISGDKPTVLNVEMTNSEISTGVVEIIGDKSLVNLESGKTEIKLSSEEIKDMNVTDVKSIATMQVGVSQSTDGLQIRGGRVYENQYVVDGISASDPLAGTGFGVDIAKNAIDEFEIQTGGADAEYGGGTSGVIIAKTKEGSKKLRGSFSWMRDNFGFNKNQGMHWNTDIASFTLGGPLLPRFPKKDSSGTKLKMPDPKLFFFTSVSSSLSDEFMNVTANQLHSSLIPANDSIWAPRQDNKWSGTLKLTYVPKPGMKFSLSTQQSLNINQNTRSLQIIGNNAIMVPGYQYNYSLNLDNATTYTHKTNLTIFNFKYIFAQKWTIDASVARLFTNLRADANGRNFRESTVDRLYFPASIVSDPISIYNPNDSLVYVNPGPGLYNNNGISTLWHDHYAEEYTTKLKLSYKLGKSQFLAFGLEHVEQKYQWIDVTAPWIGAPIQINDSTTFASNSIGSSNDIWKVAPANGGLFFQDEIRYKGIIAYLGFRFTYWAPGKFADNAVNDPNAPVLDVIRDEYKKGSVNVFGRRFKARFLPKIRVSFPITNNNVLFFNYGHSTRLAHPRFVYAGLDPVYQNRSFLSNLGNPNIKPETTVSYEVGLKSQITKDWALTFSAFYNDKFDFIVNRKITVRDQTGRFVEKSFAINQDYARVRGVELAINRRIGTWFRGTLSGSYQAATGKSNSAKESELQIQQTGTVQIQKEQFLAWDRPFDLKCLLVFKSDTLVKIGRIPIKHFTIMISSTFKSGLRYTPVTMLYSDSISGRPFYESQFDKPYSKIGSNWFWTDIRITKEFKFFKDKNRHLSLFFEVKNIFNNKNATIINPVTGRAYENGDNLPNSYRDPKYPNPLDYGTPPTDPSRYLVPRQMMWGVNFNF